GGSTGGATGVLSGAGSRVSLLADRDQQQGDRSCGGSTTMGSGGGAVPPGVGVNSGPAEGGVYVYGLFLEGARWDEKEGVLAEARPGDMFSRLPAAHLLPRPASDPSCGTRADSGTAPPDLPSLDDPTSASFTARYDNSNSNSSNGNYTGGGNTAASISSNYNAYSAHGGTGTGNGYGSGYPNGGVSSGNLSSSAHATTSGSGVLTSVNLAFPNSKSAVVAAAAGALAAPPSSVTSTASALPAFALSPAPAPAPAAVPASAAAATVTTTTAAAAAPAPASLPLPPLPRPFSGGFVSPPPEGDFPPSAEEDPQADPHRYACPLYRTSVRAGVLSTTGQSTNFVLYLGLGIPPDTHPDFWVMQGVAALCALDD
ncbi:hypothetical protein Agub_g3172, partial [Astrephomene gubernaculifera]